MLSERLSLDFRAWGAGSAHVVDAVSSQIAKLAQTAGVDELKPTSSKHAMARINANQGQKVGGAPDCTLQAAVANIKAMVDRTVQGQVTGDQLQESQIKVASLQHRLQEQDHRLQEQDHRLQEQDHRLREQELEKQLQEKQLQGQVEQLLRRLQEQEQKQLEQMASST